jgi:hypothetical protein
MTATSAKFFFAVKAKADRIVYVVRVMAFAYMSSAGKKSFIIRPWSFIPYVMYSSP